MKSPDIQEILRYMGHKGPPGSRLEELIEGCIRQLNEVADPRHVAAPVPFQVNGELVALCGQNVHSRSLAAYLEGCTEAVLMAVTLGAGVDRLLARLAAQSVSEAHCLGCCASELLERVCDEVESSLRQSAGDCTPPPQGAISRFSPGYGDFDVSFQPHLLRAVDAGRRIGLFETAAHMLTPLKSVTAVVGIGGKTPQPSHKCDLCSKTDCPFRKENV